MTQLECTSREGGNPRELAAVYTNVIHGCKKLVANCSQQYVAQKFASYCLLNVSLFSLENQLKHWPLASGHHLDFARPGGCFYSLLGLFLRGCFQLSGLLKLPYLYFIHILLNSSLEVYALSIPIPIYPFCHHCVLWLCPIMSLSRDYQLRPSRYTYTVCITRSPKAGRFSFPPLHCTDKNLQT